jgi:glycerol-3-phosphate dehydrogenase (NAD(P)+)
MRIAILGAGAWGTALAVVASARHPVTLYARAAAHVEELARLRENRRYLPGVALGSGIECVGDLEVALAHAELIVLATPLAGLRSLCRALAPRNVGEVVWVCKGIETETRLLPHSVVAEELPGARTAALSGPSFALEVAQGRPTALTAASADPDLQGRIVGALHAGALRVYRSDDLVGVEVGGAVKNVMAIAAGISDGLQLGTNARAALVTRGLAEIMRFALAMGGRAETVMGLTGAGDLILTCTGALSRNRSVGLALGGGESLEAVLARLGHVAEGVPCARAVLALAREHGIEMPITEAVCAVLFEKLAPREGLLRLLARAPKSED